MRLDLGALVRGTWQQRREVLCGIERFPAAVGAVALFVIVINVEIAGLSSLGGEGLTRLGTATTAAAALATATVLFFEARGRKGIVVQAVSTLLSLAIGAAVWWWEPLGVAPASLLLAAALAILLAPYTARRPGFWSFSWALANATVLAFLAIAIFCAGVSAILGSLDFLFGVDIETSVYGHVWSTGIGFVGPLFALSQIPETFPIEDKPDPRDFVVGGVRVLADFVAVPLLAAYAAILHAYAIKIALQAGLPRGQIGWMVLSFGLAVLSVRILVDPFGGFARAPTRLFLRYWAAMLVVPTILLGVATAQRIAAYGLTPERYGLGLFGIFLAGVLAAQLSAHLRNDIRIIPALGAFLLVVTAFGPWGLISLPSRLQVARLHAYLADADVLEGRRLAARPQLEPEAARNVASVIRLLDDTGQTGRLRPLFEGRDDDPFRANGEDRVRLIIRSLNVDVVPRIPAADGSFWFGPGTPAAVGIGGFDLLLPYLDWTVGQPPVPIEAGGLRFEVASSAEGVTIRTPARTIFVATGELRSAIDGLAAAQPAGPKGVAVPMVDIEVDGARIGILFDHVAGRLNDDISLNGGRYLLFLRVADWN